MTSTTDTAATSTVGGEPDGAGVARLESGLVALLRWLQDRATLDDLAQQSGHALPPASWALLGHLDTRGAMRVSEIAACHGVHSSSIIPRLNALQDAGLITRGAQPADARVSMISITARGRRALSRVRAARQAALAAALQGIDAQSIGVAGDVLAAIAARLAVGPASEPVAHDRR